MILKFTLSMPNNNSWDGKWSGENEFYARAINFGQSKKANEKARKILDDGYYYYNFGDGWGAGISVEEINSKQAAQVRRKSSGFCGYDWMIDSIKEFGKIIDADQAKKRRSERD